MRGGLLFLALGVAAAVPAPAFAQRFPFERSLDVTGAAILDVSTIRGKIDVTVGEPGRIVVAGAATVRVGLTLPAHAEELARKVAANPPITRDGRTVRLRPPADPDERRAMTVNYQVRVPPDTEILSETDSGETTIGRVTGRVIVRTHSSAITLSDLGGPVEVTTGSGAVRATDMAGALRVTTGSSAFTGQALGGDVRVRTQSGAIDVSLSGGGDVDVETGSSAIRVRNARGALSAVTESGRTTLAGRPGRAWDVRTGSGSVDISVDRAVPLTLDATSRSSDVRVAGAQVQGSTSKGRVAGTIGGGGPIMRVTTRSGSVDISVGPIER